MIHTGEKPYGLTLHPISCKLFLIYVSMLSYIRALTVIMHNIILFDWTDVKVPEVLQGLKIQYIFSLHIFSKSVYENFL